MANGKDQKVIFDFETTINDEKVKDIVFKDVAFEEKID